MNSLILFHKTLNWPRHHNLLTIETDWEESCARIKPKKRGRLLHANAHCPSNFAIYFAINYKFCFSCTVLWSHTHFEVKIQWHSKNAHEHTISSENSETKRRIEQSFKALQLRMCRRVIPLEQHLNRK